MLGWSFCPPFCIPALSHLFHLSAKGNRNNVAAPQPHQHLTLGEMLETLRGHTASSCLRTLINLFPLGWQSQHSLSQHIPAQQLQPGPLATKCPSLNPSCGPKAKDVLQWTALSNLDELPPVCHPISEGTFIYLPGVFLYNQCSQWDKAGNNSRTTVLHPASILQGSDKLVIDSHPFFKRIFPKELQFLHICCPLVDMLSFYDI